MADHDKASQPTEPRGDFTLTDWSLVLAARDGDTTAADRALEKLCRIYWPPLYSYIRRDGYSVEDAQDLTQEFLSCFVHKEWLNHLQDRRGKFRSFLLTFLKHFLSDQRDRAKAKKRGGDRCFVSLDAYAAEERDLVAPLSRLTADQIYERRWAQAVMTEAARRLAEEYRQRGNAAVFEQLKDLQPGEHGERTYKDIGTSLGMSEQAVKNAVHSFRRRYSQLVRDEIAQTVTEPGVVNEEVKHLLQLFAE